MAFEPIESIVASRIGDIHILLDDPDPTTNENQQAAVFVDVVMSNSRIETRRFNLADHVSGQVISQLQQLAAFLRNKANNEILPPD